MLDKDSVLSSLADQSFAVFAEVHEQAGKDLDKQVSNTTYLGMTCSTTLPKVLDPLREVMGQNFCK